MPCTNIAHGKCYGRCLCGANGLQGHAVGGSGGELVCTSLSQLKTWGHTSLSGYSRADRTVRGRVGVRDHTDVQAAQIVQGPSTPANKRPYWRPGTGACRRPLCGGSQPLMSPEILEVLKPTPLSTQSVGPFPSRGEAGKEDRLAPPAVVPRDNWQSCLLLWFFYRLLASYLKNGFGCFKTETIWRVPHELCDSPSQQEAGW